MRIERIETYTRENIGFVRVLSDGAEGWGQMSPFNADIAATVLHRQVAPLAMGWDALDTVGLCRHIIEGTYKFPGTYVCRALCGLDTALWDLRGKVEGKSVCELLGGVPRALTPYGSSMRRDITPEAEAERMVALREQHGFRAFKMRVGSVNGHDVDQWPGRTEALVPTVRHALGDEVEILVDGNSCYTPARAIEVGRMLEAHRIGHFEEPCPYWELDWTAEVTRTLSMPVAGGEQDYDLNQWKRITFMHAVDIAQPDVCYIGGLTRALAAARMAEHAGMPVVPHSANVSMVTIFTMHMMGAIPNAGPHFELSIEPAPWAEGLYEPALRVVDGQCMIPSGPGWGVTLNQDWLRSSEVHASTPS